MADWQTQFLGAHRLPVDYIDMATRWFEPLAVDIAMRQKSASKPILVAVNGSQGSGKSTLCDYLCQSLKVNHQRSAIAMSLDDFYLTREERNTLATDVHPLLQTRGVPGTHDHQLLDNTLAALMQTTSKASVAIPRFDKSTDDRQPQELWQRLSSPVDVILLEGWCMGATAQAEAELHNPINTLESENDADCVWRTHSNSVLRDKFHPLYAMVDLWIMLAAPSFETVLGWRREQEHKLAEKTPGKNEPNQIMDDATVAFFINHFERITRHCLENLPMKVHHFHQLDSNRAIIAYRNQPRAQVAP
ncbi:MAG: hypothetical protein AB8C02_04915 [Halioglobus sp.]